MEHAFDAWITNRDVIVTAGPPPECPAPEAAELHELSQEPGDFDDDHSEEGLFDYGLDAPMGQNEPLLQNNHHDEDNDQNNGIQQVPSPSALVSPDRRRRRTDSS